MPLINQSAHRWYSIESTRDDCTLPVPSIRDYFARHWRQTGRSVRDWIPPISHCWNRSRAETTRSASISNTISFFASTYASTDWRPVDRMTGAWLPKGTWEAKELRRRRALRGSAFGRVACHFRSFCTNSFRLWVIESGRSKGGVVLLFTCRRFLRRPFLCRVVAWESRVGRFREVSLSMRFRVSSRSVFFGKNGDGNDSDFRATTNSHSNERQTGFWSQRRYDWCYFWSDSPSKNKKRRECFSACVVEHDVRFCTSSLRRHRVVFFAELYSVCIKKYFLHLKKSQTVPNVVKTPRTYARKLDD